MTKGERGERDKQNNKFLWIIFLYEFINFKPKKRQRRKEKEYKFCITSMAEQRVKLFLERTRKTEATMETQAAISLTL